MQQLCCVLHRTEAVNMGVLRTQHCTQSLTGSREQLTTHNSEEQPSHDDEATVQEEAEPDIICIARRDDAGDGWM